MMSCARTRDVLSNALWINKTVKVSGVFLKKEKKEKKRYPYCSGELHHKCGHTENYMMLAKESS